MTGPRAARELIGAAGISQATFSRVVARHADDLLTVGRARATRYALRRRIDPVGTEVPIHEIDERGGARTLADLCAVAPGGFFVRALGEDAESRFHDDLPWFLHDLRPAGFLGRLVPRMHPELGLPGDVRVWSGDQCLRYLAAYGADLPGGLIVGDAAFRLYLERVTLAPIAPRDRARAYEHRATHVLSASPVGSSAVGEQPKFLARKLPGPVDVLVKFSPQVRDPVGERLADLLVAEHLAHEVLTRHGRSAAKSEIIARGDRIFLEVERFDRTAAGGRRGMVSLFALDAEYVGRLRRWSETAAALLDLGLIDDVAARELTWLEWFGHLIANTDMHFGNAAFFARGARILGLTPVYDMVPTLLAPDHGHLLERPFAPPTPDPAVGPIWGAVSDAAEDFWGSVSADGRISRGFRRVAGANQSVVSRLRSLGRRLPAGP